MTKQLASRTSASENRPQEKQMAEASPQQRAFVLEALFLTLACFVIGLFFMRPNMGEPDSYREALSALKYIDEGVYSSYWDHPLSMYVFVAGTRIARFTGIEQVRLLNLLAVVLGALSVLPFFQITEKLTDRRTAVFASAALIFSPAFIEFSSYLSHEIVGFSFALWAVYLFQRALESRRRVTVLLFGFFFAATWCARPSAIFFIAPPLLVLFIFHVREKQEWNALMRAFLFAPAGAVGCLAAVYRPALVRHLQSYSSSFLFTYYEFGRYYKSSYLILQSALTPVVLALVLAASVLLVAKRKYLIIFFAGSWIITTYVFYSGMYSMQRYFLILLPPALILIFAGANVLDIDAISRKVKRAYLSKAAVFLLLILAALGPNLPKLFYVHKNNDDKTAATNIGRMVGRNLLFTTASEPMLLFYNRENTPETVYLVTEYSPGKVVMKMDALHLAEERLRQGRPVFMTGEIIRHFSFVPVAAEYQLVWDSRPLQLYRLTSLRFTDNPRF
jgi:4-amino-4-deoxy-L-arabinose transferase-like glycosyltransferase